MEDKLDVFTNIFWDVRETYIKNMKDKGESWKTLPMDFLHKKMSEELDEFSTSEYSYDELIDVILVSLMIAKRLK